jgi:hypothetical protein
VEAEAIDGYQMPYDGISGRKPVTRTALEGQSPKSLKPAFGDTRSSLDRLIQRAGRESMQRTGSGAKRLCQLPITKIIRQIGGLIMNACDLNEPGKSTHRTASRCRYSLRATAE